MLLDYLVLQNFSTSAVVVWRGSMREPHFPKKLNLELQSPLELVYADICGPITPSTISGGKYFLLIVDDFSRLMWVAILKNKLEVVGAFQKFKTLAESESNRAFTSEEFMVANSLLKNDQSGVKRKAFKGSSLLHVHPNKME